MTSAAPRRQLVIRDFAIVAFDTTMVSVFAFATIAYELVAFATIAKTAIW